MTLNNHCSYRESQETHKYIMCAKCRVCFTLKLALETVNGLMVYFGTMKRKSNCWNSITMYYFVISIIWHLQRWSYLPG